MKYMLELTNELRAEIKKEAALLKISMNDLIVLAVAEYIQRKGGTKQ